MRSDNRPQESQALPARRSICRANDPGAGFLCPVFKAYLLADGRISTLEQFQLLRMLYGGGGIDETERRFLQEMRREVKEVSPEFEALYQQAMRD